MLVRKSVPQEEILAHPKTVLFFTHFGAHSVQEAIWHGVPVTGIPLNNDQGEVRAMAEAKGIGKGADMRDSGEVVYQTVVEVRSNPRLTRGKSSHRPAATVVTLLFCSGRLRVLGSGNRQENERSFFVRFC